MCIDADSACVGFLPGEHAVRTIHCCGIKKLRRRAEHHLNHQGIELIGIRPFRNEESTVAGRYPDGVGVQAGGPGKSDKGQIDFIVECITARENVPDVLVLFQAFLLAP